MRLAQTAISANSLKQGISLRGRQEGDAEDLLRMFRQPLCQLGSLIDPCESAADLQKWLDGLSGQFDTVAIVAGRAIALGGLYLGEGRQSHVGTLSLFIHDDFHRRGIGTLMMTVLLATAVNFIGLKRVQLLVFCDNAPAIALYQQFSFTIDGRLEYFARRGNDLLPVYSMARLMGEMPSEGNS